MTMDFAAEIVSETNLAPKSVSRTIELLDNDATVPFIARYRKEATGCLNEEQILSISERLSYFRKLEDRKATILKTIEEQGKLTDELRERIEKTREMTELEDIYLPYRPKRKTRATVAVARGLEPLADMIWAQQPVEGDPEQVAQRFVDTEKEVPDIEAAWAGARPRASTSIKRSSSRRRERRMSRS